MKKTVLLFTFIAAAFAANAQMTLTGNTYTQNFDAIGSTGLPTGWFVYNTATSSSLGIADVFSPETDFGAYYDTTDCPDDVYGTGFKNCASADNGPLASMATCSVQGTEPNRALGVRQAGASHPGYDPGASFAFEIANTISDSEFTLTFKLQGLDSASPRTTTWTLDYGIGANPTSFIPVATTPGVLNTGGYTFTNQSISATLPAALNQRDQPVWIRISTLIESSGEGNRTTTGIDDFTLNWLTAVVPSAISNVSAQPALSLTVIGQATPDKVTLAYGVEEEGAYALDIYDLTGRIIYTETINAHAGNQTITVNGLNLIPGMYIAKMNNGNSSSIARIMVQ